MSDTVALAATDRLKADADKSRKSMSWWKKFRRHRLALTGMILLIILAVCSVVGPVFLTFSPTEIDLMAIRAAPDSTHLLGTDSAGRDVLSRLLAAGRVSLAVGVVAVAIYVAIGVVLGGVAGYAGGWVDGVIMRLA
ncbi:MAG TPA: peptide ABC transporter permease, partial [Thermomicrobiales bacterium]|nr:peptide ABC transporter permease [Thermomicrobiales bacterium]